MRIFVVRTRPPGRPFFEGKASRSPGAREHTTRAVTGFIFLVE